MSVLSSAHKAQNQILDIVTDLINALPGNSFVNTNTCNNRRETVFSMRSVRTKAQRYKKFVARQRTYKHASAKMGDGVLHMTRVKELS
jgi:hypothetical protein